MVMTAEQIKQYLEQRLKNIKNNMEWAMQQDDNIYYVRYSAQYQEINDILKTIR